LDRLIGKVPLPVRSRRNGYKSSAVTDALACSLIVHEEKYLVANNRTPKRSAKLVLVINAAGLVEVVARIQVGISQEFEGIPMKPIRAGFGDDIDQTPVVVTIFGVKIIGNDPKLGNGVEVWDNSYAICQLLLNNAPIDHEAVGTAPRAAN
jgi:hypothetical protein